MTETAKWQAQKLQEAGYLYSDIIYELSKITGELESEICFLFEDAQAEVFNYDEDIIVDSGERKEKITNISPKMKRVWNAALKKTVTEAINITKTTANTSHSTYIQACDLAHMQVSSGAFDYVTAIRNGIRAAAKHGVTITYPSGWKDTLDVAVRRSILTGINQTAGELQEMRAKEMKHDIMELTAHSGARPEHAKWQGKLVSLSGKKGYLSLRDIGYGKPGGFKGINCRHNWHMYFKGMPRAYTDKELKDMQNETVVYNGQPVPVWKAREYQRSLERDVKKNKCELIMYDEARKSTDDEALKAGLDIDFGNASKRLKEREAKLKHFCKETGLKYDSSRVQVFSAETENGIRSWDRSIAQKAVTASKRTLTNSADSGIIKSGAISGARNPYGEKAQEHADKYYGLVRSMKTDVSKIAKTTGISENKIQEVKDFIFNEKHDLGGVEKEYFKPDYMMSESWKRLIEGNPEPHDITLINHEITERELMKQGYTQAEAHIIASEKHNYAKEAAEFYDRIEKYKD